MRRPGIKRLNLREVRQEVEEKPRRMRDLRERQTVRLHWNISGHRSVQAPCIAIVWTREIIVSQRGSSVERKSAQSLAVRHPERSRSSGVVKDLARIGDRRRNELKSTAVLEMPEKAARCKIMIVMTSGTGKGMHEHPSVKHRPAANRFAADSGRFRGSARTTSPRACRTVLGGDEK